MPAKPAPHEEHRQAEQIRQHVQQERGDRRAPRLQLKLQGDGAAEDECADQRAQGVPLREDDERHGDEEWRSLRSIQHIAENIPCELLQRQSLDAERPDREMNSAKRQDAQADIDRKE